VIQIAQLTVLDPRCDGFEDSFVQADVVPSCTKGQPVKAHGRADAWLAAPRRRVAGSPQRVVPRWLRALGVTKLREAMAVMKEIGALDYVAQ
jgi:hypothetical protein